MPPLDPQCGNAQTVARQVLPPKPHSLSVLPSIRQPVALSAIKEAVSPPVPDTGCPSPAPVHRLIRHCINKQYLKGGHWTSEPKYATSFSDSLEAARACTRYNLRDVELVIRIGDAGCHIFTIPLR
jgi:hypothetical protein